MTGNILEILTAGQGGQVVDNLARSFGLDQAQAASVLAAVVPELAWNMERQSFNRGGLADMVSALGRADYTKALSAAVPLSSPEVQQEGVDALDTMLWSKDRSRTVAHRAARETGVDENIIKTMMPAIASVLLGGIDQKAGATFRNIATEVGAPVPKAANIGVGDQQPLPVPGERPGMGRSRNPYGDLSDIIRRGGKSIPGGGPPRAPAGGGNRGGGTSIDLPQGGVSLDKVIRDVLGGIAGFQSNSVIGWIIRYFLVRWGWNFIQSILRRLLRGR